MHAASVELFEHAVALLHYGRFKKLSAAKHHSAARFVVDFAQYFQRLKIGVFGACKRKLVKLVENHQHVAFDGLFDPGNDGVAPVVGRNADSHRQRFQKAVDAPRGADTDIRRASVVVRARILRERERLSDVRRPPQKNGRAAFACEVAGGEYALCRRRCDEFGRAEHKAAAFGFQKVAHAFEHVGGNAVGLACCGVEICAAVDAPDGGVVVVDFFAKIAERYVLLNAEEEAVHKKLFFLLRVGFGVATDLVETVIPRCAGREALCLVLRELFLSLYLVFHTAFVFLG